MNEFKIKAYRVRASVNPTHRANAERTRVSSGRVPLYNLIILSYYINLAISTKEKKKANKVALKVSAPPRDDIFISNTKYKNFTIPNIRAEEATVALMVRRSLVERVLPKRILGSNPGRGASAFLILLNLMRNYYE